MTTAFPTFASEIIKQQKSSPWIIDSCAFCSDLNNLKPSLTHVFTVFCPLSHASWDAAYPPLFHPTPPPTAPPHSSAFLYPPVNRHRRRQERPDLFCGWHHDKKGGPERYHLHLPGIQRLDVGSPSDVRQHGHQSGDFPPRRCQTAANPPRTCFSEHVGAAAFWPRPHSPDSPFWCAALHKRICISIMLAAPLLTWIIIMLINCSQSYFAKVIILSESVQRPEQH